ncbi:cupredoxin domain-containing protein [Ktedonospora formicarum]|uniref:EfeO-type cupredoxin-like domain-containing protein n=1 Tax=Ktedonospora formicarum TaxID=2778364 RepID=A0A8J3I5D1_9CHLR|nr:hypothetical protein [Ktedonospora formicarum]GHO46203.1 hypothetical protein KSX_43660 [Ktedonospora formicarum]
MKRTSTRHGNRFMFFIAGCCLTLLILILSACGGDNGSTTSTTSNTSNNSTTAITIKESRGPSGDVYTFDPTTLTVKKGDKVTIENQTDEVQEITGGDASKAGVNVKIPINEKATTTFNTAGTFTIKTNKEATITVQVQ